MTAILTNSTIESVPHNNIISLLDNRNYVTDPRNPNSTLNLRQFIYETDPFGKAINFGDFPYIVCEFPIIEYSNISTDGKVKTILWTHSIIVRAVRDGSSNTRTDIGRSDMLSIANSLQNFFNTESNKQIMRNYNIHFPSLTKLNVDNIALQEQEVYEWTYSLTYKERFTVSD